jgi:hypothetical protein
VIAWAWWPSLRTTVTDIDTLVVHDGVLGNDGRPFTDRLHEAGRTVQWLTTDDVCGAVQDAGTGEVDVVIIAGDDVADCPDVLDVLAQNDRVIVFDPAVELGRTVHSIDTSAMLGEAGETWRPCEWWDAVACDRGNVAVRDESGLVTEAGADRLGRLAVAELP